MTSWPQTGQAPAGWYPDPTDPYALRWWDGTQWTAHRSPSPPHWAAPAPSRRKSTPTWAVAVVGAAAALAVVVLGASLTGGADVSFSTSPAAQGLSAPIERAFDASVYVYAPCDDGWCVGTAVAVSPTELLTANHVVSDDDSAILADIAGNEFEGTVIMRDEGADLALIETGYHGLPVIEVRTGTIAIGETAYAIGAPGDEMRITEGAVMDISDDEGDGVLEIDTSADVDPGNSGGPLLDVDGRLIGIVKEENPEDDAQGWATHARDVLDFLETGYA